MPVWERDYGEIQGQMIVGENVSFGKLIEEVKLILHKINNYYHIS
jgi:hypothetical protein